MRFYVQNESPGEDQEPNWLLAPEGPFVAAMRLYGDADHVFTDGIRTMVETSLDKVAAKVYWSVVLSNLRRQRLARR